ncbi:DNA mismatch repair protein Msh6 [Achlya hypogyna]|uniref:DNA mismatch repair protein n=1 Tax=Achlya hypogyna TaxID=1202772 RepID=A0A1V9Z7D6_ACHHY|nr:DNA mismatch repair protein Msh6 [Achlya hypogyna]
MKQQSLLSFFSPPAKKATNGKETPAQSKPSPLSSATKPLAKKPTPAKTTPAKSTTPKATPAKTAKTTPAKEAQNETTPAKTSTPRVELTPQDKSRKAYEDALGTSSEDGSDDEPLTKKRKRLTKPTNKTISVSDDEEEWKATADAAMEESDDGSVSLASESSEEEKPLKKKPARTPPAKAASKKTAFPIKASTPVKIKDESSGATKGGTLRQHDSWPWLHVDRRDKAGHRPDHPDYDPRTISIPNAFLKKETPAMQQWWEVKCANMDTVLFFKVGKFYELFHMDADVGFKELGLNYMKGEKAHSGFPEKAYAKYSAQLVQKGFRVARVEQTETPEMLKARATKSKVVRREICSLLSPGTNTVSFLDGSTPALRSGTASFLLALKELDGAYGVCLVDCTTGAFQIGQFVDTPQRDRLRTVLAQFHVVEIVHERHGLTKDTKAVLNHGLATATCVRTELKAGAEMWDTARTLRELEKGAYFGEAWPAALKVCVDTDGTVKAECALAVGALGGCVWNLRRSLIDHELLSLGQFATYTPPDEMARASAELTQQYVVLDGHTIHNLELLRNNYNGSRQGSLLEQLDKTVTGFGRRLFEDWLLKPLCAVPAIDARLDAVADLIERHSTVVEVRSILKALPDLERLLSRIHALGSAHRAQSHPDSRAIMYESSSYNVRKIKDFVAALNGFKASRRVVDLLKTAGVSAPLLTSWLAAYPDLQEVLAFFDDAFDHSVALSTGTIQPQAGVDDDYDAAAGAVEDVLAELDAYLQSQRTALRCKNIVYWGAKREDRFQLEVPESALGAKQPREYELKSKKKGYKRFHTPEVRALLARLMAAEDKKEAALKDQTRKMFATFDKHYASWLAAVQSLATLDCLLSLALISGQSDGYVRPTFDVSAETPFLDVVDGKHPSIAASLPDFIPNDTRLGGPRPMLLLSGPNMGGKSTLLRQNCILVLMAQMGCYVPAAACHLSPVDRIFTRLGASDRILAGQSTLFVELAETATILRHASRHSLVILDELGRGTSTFDGTAIAYAVVEHLLKAIGCRTMFATHYHSLVEEYIENPRVALGHMDCMVDPTNADKVVFLYKLAEGICPKSYGLNVATLADLPDAVVQLAGAKSAEFEEALKDTFACSELQSAVRNAVAAGDASALRALWRELA